MKRATMRLLPALLVALRLVRPLPADVFHMPAGLTSLEMVVVGDAGNPPDDTGSGAVAFREQRAAIRQGDSNRHRTVQVVFNLVPLSSWKAYLPVIDSFQIDRYSCGAGMPYFGQQGDWGLLIMAWSMAHGAAALEEFPHLRNPAPCMPGVGLGHREGHILGLWRDPLYEETRYMAYASGVARCGRLSQPNWRWCT